jgi:hypothetical protein
MGYSKSIATFHHMEFALKLLAEGQPCEWNRTSDDADVWAYKIREALFIAQSESRKNPTDLELKRYADAQALFKIQVINSRLVRAVFANSSEIQEEPRATVQALTPGPGHRVSQIQSLEDLQGVWRNAQPSNDKMHFPDCRLDEAELHLAAAWAASLTPPWMLLRPKGTNALTLAPDDPRIPTAAKVSGVPRAVSADAPPAQVSDKTPSGRAWEKLPTLAPPAKEPPDLDGHGENHDE